jgi:ribose transport system substrate-binding protein
MGLAAIALAGASVVLLAGCTSTSAPSGGGTAGGDAGPDLVAAQAIVDPMFKTGDRPLLIDTKLKTPLKPGLRIAFMDAKTPIAATMFQILDALTPTTGIQFTDVQMSGADEINTAMNSIVEGNYDAVINVAIDPQFFEAQRKQLKDNGVPLVAASINNGPQYDIQVMNGSDVSKYAGKSVVAMALLRTEGKVTDFVYFNTPELAFSNDMKAGANDAMKELCPSCKMDNVDIPVMDMITGKAPDQIVSYFQAHPNVGYYISTIDENTQGLPAKASIAGLDIKGVAQTPTPINYQQVADGTEDASLTGSLPYLMYTLVEQALLEIEGTSYSFPDPVTVQNTTQMFITKSPTNTVPADPNIGWVPAASPQALLDKFLTLWGLK